MLILKNTLTIWVFALVYNMVAQVNSLHCYHCIYVEDSDGKMLNGSSTIPIHSSCKTNPIQSLSLDCSSLIDQGEQRSFQNKGLKQVVGIVNGAANEIGDSSWDVIGTRENKKQIQYTCAFLALDGEFLNVERIKVSVRTCIPTLRPSGFKETCHNGSLGALVSTHHQQDDEINLILHNFLGYFDGSTRTEVVTFKSDNCNGYREGSNISCAQFSSNSSNSNDSVVIEVSSGSRSHFKGISLWPLVTSFVVVQFAKIF